MLVVLVFSLLFSSVGMVVAQGPSSSPVGANPVGEPAVIYASDGTEAAQVTVTDAIDPFEEWEEYYDPQVGERYVVVALEIENTGDRPFAFEPYEFQLLDSVGRLGAGYFSYRNAASIVAIPDLEAASMLPGETVVGALNFTVPVDTELSQLVYMFYGEVQHLYLIADLSTGSVATPAS